jgi:hypothetical protein
MLKTMTVLEIIGFIFIWLIGLWELLEGMTM